MCSFDVIISFRNVPAEQLVYSPDNIIWSRSKGTFGDIIIRDIKNNNPISSEEKLLKMGKDRFNSMKIIIFKKNHSWM